MTAELHPIDRLRPRRRITGCAAVLLPFRDDGTVDWDGFRSLLERTVTAGLTPAVNMDTGYVQLIDPPTRARVLTEAAAVAGTAFLAGAMVDDTEGAAFAPDAYAAALDAVQQAGGTPVVFPSWGLNALEPEAWVAAHAGFATTCDRFIGFELGPQFVPYGRIYPVDAYRNLLDVTACIGAKHSSLSRQAEWDRLAVRDAVRPDFRVFTGNDLAIDMVCYGSDYLLGLAAFAPDLFARRDALWADGDAGFYELNDRLQYLGAFAFRTPVPGYRHDAAMFLRLRGWIDYDAVPSGAATRPDADRDVLAQIARDLEVLA
ncbi:MAG: dihydrodipicolinate synthase family protein [Acidimicrobiales bacterium]|nr:dihydrodipicolinate synthase family protein [Acidimicrobiales bacterium]